jgi:hypothetical protein
LLYATAFHFLAGTMTGLVFKTRALLIILYLVIGEAGLLAFTNTNFAGLWLIVSSTVIQIGYLSGVLTRMFLADAGYSIPPIDARRPR